MKVFHCNYTSQMKVLVSALSYALPSLPGISISHSYLVIKDGKFFTSRTIAVGTSFTHLSLDDTDAVKFLTSESVVPFLLGYRTTHVRD